MNKTKHILMAFGLFLIGFSESQAQQSPMFGQFQYNMLELNPAYAGYRESFNITAIHRSQWVGFDGAPVTQTLSFNKPTKEPALAFGGTLTNDKIGPSNSLYLSGDLAYRIKFITRRKRQRAMFSFGLKMSMNYYQADLQSVNLINDDDESFLYNEKGVLLPNAGFGMMLSAQRYFLGLSTNKLFENKLVNPNNELHEFMDGKERRTLYLTGGKIWKIHPQLKVYPAFMLKATQGAPISGGAFLNFLLMNDFKVGGYYNFKEVAGALVQWQVNKQLRVGYTLELPVTGLISTSLGTHELMLNYSIRRGRTAIIYPKHF